MVNISPIKTNTSHLNSFNIKKKTKTYDVGNPSPDWVMISKMPAWQPFLYFSNTLTLPSVSTSVTVKASQN
jgi:hypothetical protein